LLNISFHKFVFIVISVEFKSEFTKRSRIITFSPDVNED